MVCTYQIDLYEIRLNLLISILNKIANFAQFYRVLSVYNHYKLFEYTAIQTEQKSDIVSLSVDIFFLNLPMFRCCC